MIAVFALTFGGEEGGEVVGHRPLGSRMHVAFAEQVSNSTPTQSNARTGASQQFHTNTEQRKNQNVMI